MSQKDSFYGKTALVLSLGFWIPLFNIGLMMVAIYFAIKAIRFTDQHPEHFDGRKQATFALVIAFTTLVLTIFGTVLYAFQKFKCGTVFTQ